MRPDDPANYPLLIGFSSLQVTKKCGTATGESKQARWGRTRGDGSARTDTWKQKCDQCVSL